MSKEAEEKVGQELKKLKMMTPMSAEATVVRNYIEWIISLPWHERSEILKDLGKAEKILDEDHSLQQDWYLKLGVHQHEVRHQITL